MLTNLKTGHFLSRLFTGLDQVYSSSAYLKPIENTCDQKNNVLVT